MVTQHDLGDSIPTYDNGKLQRENIDLRAQVLRLKREHAAREAGLLEVVEAAVDAVMAGRAIVKEGVYSPDLAIVVDKREKLLNAVDAYRATPDPAHKDGGGKCGNRTQVIFEGQPFEVYFCNLLKGHEDDHLAESKPGTNISWINFEYEPSTQPDPAIGSITVPAEVSDEH